MSIAFVDDPVRAATDAALLAMGPHVYLGAVTDADDNAKTIGAPLPYLLRGLVMPFDTNLRISGRGSAVHQFTLQVVHSSDAGCMNVTNGVRDYLDGLAVTAEGREYRVRLADPTAQISVERDDKWTRPDGGALYFASDRYSVL